ncbi:NAD-dependent deacetylase [Pedobacter sp. UYP30]|uniref:SIR2 family NAD-dependent protein deacylase n=1 Tax=Pedobacter sp. UYP30 TaxID=1756400 RepID=UPI0033914F95
MEKLVVFTGAGISAESGLKTFRDADGLWEGYNIEDVATPEAWRKNPELVQNFYNERREQVLKAEPNEAHKIIASLEEFFEVSVITQNIDDLHERAGSKNVVHLHGLITKSQSDKNSSLTYSIMGSNIEMGTLCELGSQLRPHVVWFGEEVPMIEEASFLCSKADVFVLVGSSLAVYPAAGLLQFVPSKTIKYIVDPKIPSVSAYQHVVKIEEKAVIGMKEVKELLLNER